MFELAKEHQCYLIDAILPSNVACNINYIGKTIFKCTNAFFDVIIISHVLEHIGDPKKLLQEILTRANSNGWVYIEVPLGCVYEWRMLREPITHVNFFSEYSLTYLAKSMDLR